MVRIHGLMLQVEREGLGPAPGHLLLWDRKSHALARIKTKRGSMRKRVVIAVL